MGFIFAFIVRRAVIGDIPTLEKFFDYFAGDIWEILLIKMNGLNKGKEMLNSAAWTLSAMLIAEFFIFGCMWCLKKKYTDFILPVTLLIGYGLWRQLESCDHALWIGFTTFGVLRAYLIIGLSYYCLMFSRKLSNVPLKKSGKVVLTIISILLYICVFLIMLFKLSRNYQWLILLLFAVLITISLSGHNLINKAISRFRICSVLGEFSMNIFLAHVPVYHLFMFWYSDPYEMYSHKFEFMGMVFIAAVVHWLITRYAVEFVRWAKNATKSKLTITP